MAFGGGAKGSIAPNEIYGLFAQGKEFLGYFFGSLQFIAVLVETIPAGCRQPHSSHHCHTRCDHRHCMGQILAVPAHVRRNFPELRAGLVVAHAPTSWLSERVADTRLSGGLPIVGLFA
jgi:hypothetical protein